MRGYMAAGVHLEPGGIISWIVIGLVAGAIAGRLVRGRGYGCLMDIVVGIIGAFIGGAVVQFFVPPNEAFGFWGSLIVATLGAVILLGLIRLLSGR